MGRELQVAVVGPTGYAGLELTRLLIRHPRVKTPLLLSRESKGGIQNMPRLLPQVNLNGQGAVDPFSWSLIHSRGVDLLFLATPHEVSRAWVPEAARHGLRVIDLSGAWRLRSPQHIAAYGFQDPDPADAKAITKKTIYGLPELRRKQLPNAQLVANPGCYPTSVILALAPLLKAGLVDQARGVVCDSKSGVSGAGKAATPETHFVETAENFRAYSAFTHRHAGEILEQLGLTSRQLIFSTHLLPIRRGILSSIYVHLRRRVSVAALSDCLRSFYEGSAFVRVFDTSLPQIQFCTNTNYCDIGFVLAPDRRRVMLVSCLDNLLKGAAGQAVQNMNLMYGWDETEGFA